MVARAAPNKEALESVIKEMLGASATPAYETFVMINPKKEPERFKFLQEHLPARGLPNWTAIVGPWGSELTPELVFQIYDPFHTLGNWSTPHLTWKAAALSRGELSLLATFKLLLDTVAARPDGPDAVMVFESDIVLREGFGDFIGPVLEGALVAEPDWDYISLSEGVGTRIAGMDGKSYWAPLRVVPVCQQFVFRCCDAMIFRRRFLLRLRETFFPARECLDWWMNLQFLYHKGKAVWVDPPLAEQGSNRLRVPTTLPA